MQIERSEKSVAKVTPYNEVAELIDREIHRKTLEQINVLAREYEIRNPSEVAAFLSENKSLIDLLEEIPERIREFFGDGQNLRLQFFLDPEDPNYHRLAVGILTKAKKPSSLLQKFDENWWFENERKSQSKISIDLESAG